MELSGRKRHCAWLRHRGLFMKRRPNACLSFVLKRVGLGTGDAGSTGERDKAACGRRLSALPGAGSWHRCVCDNNTHTDADIKARLQAEKECQFSYIVTPFLYCLLMLSSEALRIYFRPLVLIYFPFAGLNFSSERYLQTILFYNSHSP